MSTANDASNALASFTAFATTGVLNLTQDLTHAVLNSIGEMEGADPELVAEETLCLTATATARAAEVGAQDTPARAASIQDVLLQLPYTYRDYLIGCAMIEGDDPDLREVGATVRHRLQHKQQFYTSHLPAGQFPGPHALRDVMEMWMGRVSPPKLPESPQDRLQHLGLVDAAVTHCKLILAYGRRGGPPTDE
jgi:hypothetical protein